VRRQPLEHIAQVGKRVDAQVLASGGEAKQHGRRLAPLIAAACTRSPSRSLSQ
jgi:hypothetical protein